MNNKIEKRKKREKTKQHKTQIRSQDTKRSGKNKAIESLARMLGFVMFVFVASCAYDPAESPKAKPESTKVKDQKVATSDEPQRVLRVMEISDEIVISENIAHIDRLILNKGAVIRTLGQDVTIRARELIADDAIIDTMPKAARAAYGKKALDGGFVKIFAGIATGSLHINARGQHGAHGKAGKRGAKGATGAKGHDARDRRELECMSLPPETFLLDFRPEPPRCWHRTVCDRRAGNGARGGRGKTGYRGENGFAGGDTGKFFVHVKEPKDFKVTYDFIAGTGGQGGSGGPGGPGGDGGKAGKGTKECGNAEKGPLGPVGFRGASGAAGHSGLDAPFCIQLAGFEIGNCHNFEDLTHRGGT